MIRKLAVVTVVVTDQDRAVDFYTRVLGLEKRNDVTLPGNQQRWVTVAPKGQDLELSLFHPGSSQTSAVQRSWRPGGNPTWTFHSDDCRGDFESLKSRGVKFNEPHPIEYPWGLVATFSDPDGNNFSLLEQPHERK